jgi:hypothetical protein
MLRPKQYQETNMATNIQPPLVQKGQSYARESLEKTLNKYNKNKTRLDKLRLKSSSPKP